MALPLRTFCPVLSIPQHFPGCEKANHGAMIFLFGNMSLKLQDPGGVMYPLSLKGIILEQLHMSNTSPDNGGCPHLRCPQLTEAHHPDPVGECV